MHMAVDEARQQQVRPVVDGFGAGGGSGFDLGIVASGDDLAALDEKRAVFLIGKGGVIVGGSG